MTKKLYPEESVSDIAAAIREKNGLSTTYNVSEMGPAVRAIPVNDTFWTQENRNNLATILENVPIVADNADAAASINTIRNSFISALRGGVTPAEPVLVSISVTPTSITVPSGTTASQVKNYLTSMTGHYETAGVSGQTTRDLTSELSSATVSGTMPTPGNTSTMTISYSGKSTTVSVTMEAAAPTLTGLTATYTGGAVAAGTTLDQLNEVVKATYSDGSTSAALTKGTDYTLSGTLTPGQTNTITVTGAGTYAGFTTTFSVTVEAAAPTLTGLTATYTGGTVAAGTTLSQLTEVVKATYSDGSTSAALIKGTDYTLSGTLTPGQANTITVTGKSTYTGFTTTFSVTVEAAAPTLTGLSATYTGGTVAAGTTLSQLTEVVKATYSDGTTSAALTKGTDYTLSGTLTAGQANTVTVTGAGTYAGYTTTFSVTVDAPITLSRLKVTYDNGAAVAAGTTLAQLNEVVRAVYSDNSESDVLVENTDYTLSGTLTPGQTNTVTVTGKGTYAGLTAVTFEVTVKAAASTTHSITYDSTVDGAQTVTFTPMPTEVNDGTSTTITMAAKALTASYYEKATGIAINEVRKSSVKVGTTKTEGTGTLTISNQKADAVVTAAPTLFFHSTNQAYTDGTVYKPVFNGYVNACVSGLYELKAEKHYIYTDGGSKYKFRVVFVRADYTAMGGSEQQPSGTVIKLGGANSDLPVPDGAKYFFIRYSAINKDPAIVQTALTNAHMLLECE